MTTGVIYKTAVFDHVENIVADQYKLHNFTWEELIKESNGKLRKINLDKLIPNLNPESVLLQENIFSDISNLRLTTSNHVIPLLTRNGKIEGDFTFKTPCKNKRVTKTNLVFTQTLDMLKIRCYVPYNEGENLICFYVKNQNNFLAFDSKIKDYDKPLDYNLSNALGKLTFRNLHDNLNDIDLIICMALSTKFEKLYHKCKTLSELYANFEFQMEDTFDLLYMSKLIKSQIKLITTCS